MQTDDISRAITYYTISISRAITYYTMSILKLLLQTDDISRAISKLKQTKSNLERQPRRSCSLAVGIRDKDIIGKVFQLLCISRSCAAQVVLLEIAFSYHRGIRGAVLQFALYTSPLSKICE